MHVPSLIEKKRDGQALTTKEIKTLVEDFTLGDVPDYQMSALAMAIFFRGMSPAETYHLTDAMMNSGRVLKYPDGSPPKIDKQSTGGVGDKVSLVLAPLLACDDVWVPTIVSAMMRLTKSKRTALGGVAVLSGSDLVLTVTPGGQSLAKP